MGSIESISEDLGSLETVGTFVLGVLYFPVSAPHSQLEKKARKEVQGRAREEEGRAAGGGEGERYRNENDGVRGCVNSQLAAVGRSLGADDGRWRRASLH
jgi:hypothetical protein